MPSPLVPATADRPLARAAAVLLGCLMLSVGVACLIRANVGIDPVTATYLGVCAKTGLGLGTVTAALGVASVVAWSRGVRPGPASLAQPVLCSAAIPVALAHLPSWSWGALFGTGALLVPVGAACYLSADAGPGPVDGVLLVLARHFSLRTAGFTLNALYLTVAVLLGQGSAFKGGSVVGALVSPMLIAALLPHGRRALGRSREPVPERQSASAISA